MLLDVIIIDEGSTMEHYLREGTSTFVSLDERTRLVQLCARIVGDREAAEDLAQETLLEAWRHDKQS